MKGSKGTVNGSEKGEKALVASSKLEGVKFWRLAWE